MEQETWNFCTFKEKLIKTDELIKLYFNENNNLKNLKHLYKDLEDKHQQVCGLLKRYELENERLTFTTEQFRSRQTKLDKENIKLTAEKKTLEDDLNKQAVDNMTTIKELEDKLKMSQSAAVSMCNNEKCQKSEECINGKNKKIKVKMKLQNGNETPSLKLKHEQEKEKLRLKYEKDKDDIKLKYEKTIVELNHENKYLSEQIEEMCQKNKEFANKITTLEQQMEKNQTKSNSINQDEITYLKQEIVSLTNIKNQLEIFQIENEMLKDQLNEREHELEVLNKLQKPLKQKTDPEVVSFDDDMSNDNLSYDLPDLDEINAPCERRLQDVNISVEDILSEMKQCPNPLSPFSPNCTENDEEANLKLTFRVPEIMDTPSTTGREIISPLSPICAEATIPITSLVGKVNDNNSTSIDHDAVTPPMPVGSLTPVGIEEPMPIGSSTPIGVEVGKIDDNKSLEVDKIVRNNSNSVQIISHNIAPSKLIRKELVTPPTSTVEKGDNISASVLEVNHTRSKSFAEEVGDPLEFVAPDFASMEEFSCTVPQSTLIDEEVDILLTSLIGKIDNNNLPTSIDRVETPVPVIEEIGNESLSSKTPSPSNENVVISQTIEEFYDNSTVVTPPTSFDTIGTPVTFNEEIGNDSSVSKTPSTPNDEIVISQTTIEEFRNNSAVTPPTTFDTSVTSIEEVKSNNSVAGTPSSSDKIGTPLAPVKEVENCLDSITVKDIGIQEEQYSENLKVQHEIENKCIQKRNIKNKIKFRIPYKYEDFVKKKKGTLCKKAIVNRKYYFKLKKHYARRKFKADSILQSIRSLQNSKINITLSVPSPLNNSTNTSSSSPHISLPTDDLSLRKLVKNLTSLSNQCKNLSDSETGTLTNTVSSQELSNDSTTQDISEPLLEKLADLVSKILKNKQTEKRKRRRSKSISEYSDSLNSGTESEIERLFAKKSKTNKYVLVNAINSQHDHLTDKTKEILIDQTFLPKSADLNNLQGDIEDYDFDQISQCPSPLSPMSALSEEELINIENLNTFECNNSPNSIDSGIESKCSPENLSHNDSAEENTENNESLPVLNISSNDFLPCSEDSQENIEPHPKSGQTFSVLHDIHNQQKELRVSSEDKPTITVLHHSEHEEEAEPTQYLSEIPDLSCPLSPEKVEKEVEVVAPKCIPLERCPDATEISNNSINNPDTNITEDNSFNNDTFKKQNNPVDIESYSIDCNLRRSCRAKSRRLSEAANIKNSDCDNKNVGIEDTCSKSNEVIEKKLIGSRRNRQIHINERMEREIEIRKCPSKILRSQKQYGNLEKNVQDTCNKANKPVNVEILKRKRRVLKRPIKEPPDMTTEDKKVELTGNETTKMDTSSDVDIPKLDINVSKKRKVNMTKIKSNVLRQMREKSKMFKMDFKNPPPKVLLCDKISSNKNSVESKKINSSKKMIDESKDKLLQQFATGANSETSVTSKSVMLSSTYCDRQISSPCENVLMESHSKTCTSSNSLDLVTQIIGEMDKDKQQTTIQHTFPKKSTPLTIEDKQWRANILEIAEITQNPVDVAESFDCGKFKHWEPGNIKTKLTLKLKILMDRLLESSTEEKIPDEIVLEFKRLDLEVIVNLLLKRLSEDIHERPTDRYPAPLMTNTQRLFLRLLLQLETEKVDDIVEMFLTKTEILLFKIGTNVKSVVPITRLYLAICRLQGDINRIRNFCCQAFFYMSDMAVPVFFTVLTSWIDVLPLEADWQKYSMSKILVQIVHLKSCNKQGYNLTPLRQLLHQHYGYPRERWNCDEMFQELSQQYLSDPSPATEFAIHLLCKNKDTKWLYKKLNEFFKPLIYKIPSENVNFKSQVILLVGKLCRQFKPKVCHDETCLVELRRFFAGIIEGENVDELIQRSVNLSINRLPKNIIKDKKKVNLVSKLPNQIKANVKKKHVLKKNKQ